MHPAFRPPPPRLDFDAEGEDIQVLASIAHRDASEAALEGILRRERELQVYGENIAWREAHLDVRAARWVRSRIIFTAVVASSILGYALWFRYTDTGRYLRIGFVQGQYEKRVPPGTLWDEPHWLTADMTRAEIEALNARAEAQRAAKEVP